MSDESMIEGLELLINEFKLKYLERLVPLTLVLKCNIHTVFKIIQMLEEAGDPVSSKLQLKFPYPYGKLSEDEKE